MAEKRRGLGRGLGSLIPSQEPGRPSDVFFPRGERSNDAAADRAEEGVRERRSSDPAESMRRAQAGRRSAAGKRTNRSTSPAKTTAGAKTAVAADEEASTDTPAHASADQVSTRSAGKKASSAAAVKGRPA